MARILIVDDDPTIQDLIQDVLSGQGHAFDIASSGNAAIKKMGSKAYDLVILDRSMPEMSGLEVLKQMRSTPATAGTKVLMCTAAEMLADVDDAFRAGATDYVVKPLDFAKLRAKVSTLTRKG